MKTLLHVAGLSFALPVMLISGSALAQDPAPPLPPAPPPAAPLPVAPTTVAAPPAVAEAAPAAAPTTPAAAKWYDALKFEGFIDGYAGVNYNIPKPESGPAVETSTGPGYLGTSEHNGTGNVLRGYDRVNGFSLHWVGLNASYEPAPVGGKVALRFGPSAVLYNGNGLLDNEIGLTWVKEAYASWKPGGADSKIKLIFGKFDTIYGAEVADSQYNMTYTRPILNYYMQPFYHTGLRLDWQMTDVLDMKLMVVNGWNNSAEKNWGKGIGGQLNFKPNDLIFASVGYLASPEGNDWFTSSDGTLYDRGGNNSRFRHMIDGIVDITPTKELRFLLNADYITETYQDVVAGGPEKSDSRYWYGIDATAKYAFTDQFYVAVRGEYVQDEKKYVAPFSTTPACTDTLTTSCQSASRPLVAYNGTLTLGYLPTPNLILKLEQRYDGANEPHFRKGVREYADGQMTTTLGVVVTTN